MKPFHCAGISIAPVTTAWYHSAMKPIVTLTTDFGMKDPYVAAMKGVLHRMCPGISVVDLTHDIDPQNVLEGALFVAASAPYFPIGTIHVVVVDPGVGTGRRPVVVLAAGQFFVTPDNGLLTLFVREHPIEEARIISNPGFMLDDVSPTFHGRDVFAPAAAKLAAGATMSDAGPRLDEIHLVDIPEPQRDGGHTISGEIIHIDRFGNAISNILRSSLGDAQCKVICVGQTRFDGIHQTYADTEPNTPLALFGSVGALEFAVNQGSASATLGLRLGDRVEIHL